jgi:hypothetical protein
LPTGIAVFALDNWLDPLFALLVFEELLLPNQLLLALLVFEELPLPNQLLAMAELMQKILKNTMHRVFIVTKFCTIIFSLNPNAII